MSKFGSVRITDENGDEIVQVIGGALLTTGSGSGSSASENLGDDGSDLLTEIKKIRRGLELILNHEIKVEDL